MDYAVKIISQDETTAVVGGYGVVFGGKDLVGDTFTKDTNFMLDLVPNKPAMYDHGMTAVKNFLGSVPNDNIKADDKGLWVEMQINRAAEYADEVLKLIESGALGYSSGSVPHLVQRAQKSITQWPIVEFSLTPTPAEPRTIGVERIKSLAEQDERFKAFLPEGAGDASADATLETDGEIKTNQGNDTQGDDTMSEEKKEQEVKAAPQGATIDEIKRLFSPLMERIEKLEKQPAAKAPAVLNFGRGDDENKSFYAWVKGQGPGNTEFEGNPAFELKASNATDMNIGTAADGGNLVPTGFLPSIIARRDESMLRDRLGCRFIPGIGTAVDVPLDGEADGEFVTTTEANTFDEDSPAMGKKSLTLVMKTKYLDVSYQLLNDTPVALEAFLGEWVGRGLAKTHNAMLLTEVAANGTNLKSFASASAIAFGEPEDIVGNEDLSNYLDSDTSVAWVGRSSTFWNLMSIVGDDRQYGQAAQAMGMGRNLLGYPYLFSAKAAAEAASAKSLYFGNWNYVGYREAPGLTFIRDPYTVAVTGQVRLLWHTQIVYGVLQAEAIGYGEHPTA
jgi:HK97 family phage major capsid protein